MSDARVLVANRGEIALRVLQSAHDLNLKAIAVHCESDRFASHVLFSQGNSVEISGQGAAAYLNTSAILSAAQKFDCNLIHPGYGFLSESADFAEQMENAGITWVGPTVSQLRLFGNKLSARSQAVKVGLPILDGSAVLRNPGDLESYIRKCPSNKSFVLKAVAGGGGRGIRVIDAETDLEAAFLLACEEAKHAFGSGDVYIEEFFEGARHIEVQVVGDGNGQVEHLGERDCSLQRNRQKIVELAPAPSLPEEMRSQLFDGALSLARSVGYRGVGTVEFMVDPRSGRFYFIEVNARLQVEHTITEMLYGIDLARVQLQLALGEKLDDVLITKRDKPAGSAVQMRINAEKLSSAGSFLPSTGVVSKFRAPLGIGIRVDPGVREGFEVSGEFDSLLAKLIVHNLESDLSSLLRKGIRALSEFEVRGVDTNIDFLMELMKRQGVVNAEFTTSYIDEIVKDSRKKGSEQERIGSDVRNSKIAGSGLVTIEAQLRGNVVKIPSEEDQVVSEGQTLLIVEAMKMHHEIKAPASGLIKRIKVHEGEVIDTGQPVIELAVDSRMNESIHSDDKIDLDDIRADLKEVIFRHSLVMDEQRGEAVAKRRKIGSRTARENVDDLCDEDSFLEYGALAIAAQRRRRSVDELQIATPADGLVAGFGTVNSTHFGEDRAKCAVLAYDYTVLAGTQGHNSHKKKDRIFELARDWETPVVFFTEGGGGRPGDVDTDDLIMSWLDIKTFATWPQLGGIAPRIAINSGRCFAGNAVIFGCADITIATKNSNIGLAGPAMIDKSGGLGKFKSEDIGPSDTQSKNGVIDLLCKDESDATDKAKKILGYFQGKLEHYDFSDQRILRHIIPEDRLRVYDIRKLIRNLADEGSVIELRRDYGIGLLTILLRIEGHSFGLIANDPTHLGGAIDGEGGEKGARFLQLCDCFGLPVISLCDTPGFMVGPASEETASVRRGSRLITASANLSVPLFTIVLRKGYGLGAQAMAGGSFHQPFFTIGWPTSEMGPMGLEGAVELGFRKELDGAMNERERKSIFDSLLESMYAKGKGVSVASAFDVDAVIDRRDTGDWLLMGLWSSKLSRKKRRLSRYPDVW